MLSLYHKAIFLRGRDEATARHVNEPRRWYEGLVLAVVCPRR